jgi:hypothetical protein
MMFLKGFSFNIFFKEKTRQIYRRMPEINLQFGSLLPIDARCFWGMISNDALAGNSLEKHFFCVCSRFIYLP